MCALGLGQHPEGWWAGTPPSLVPASSAEAGGWCGFSCALVSGWLSQAFPFFFNSHHRDHVAHVIKSKECHRRAGST